MSFAIRQDRLALERPLDFQLRVVPANAALVLGGVEVAALVLNLGRAARHVEPVGETGRDPQHPLVVRGEVRADPAAERRRAFAKIDGHVEDLAGRRAHELSLRLPDLVVQAAQRALHGAAVVVLHELEVDARSREPRAMPRLHEEAAVVGDDSRLDQ